MNHSVRYWPVILINNFLLQVSPPMEPDGHPHRHHHGEEPPLSVEAGYTSLLTSPVVQPFATIMPTPTYVSILCSFSPKKYIMWWLFNLTLDSYWHKVFGVVGRTRKDLLLCLLLLFRLVNLTKSFLSLPHPSSTKLSLLSHPKCPLHRYAVCWWPLLRPSRKSALNSTKVQHGFDGLFVLMFVYFAGNWSASDREFFGTIVNRSSNHRRTNWINHTTRGSVACWKQPTHNQSQAAPPGHQGWQTFQVSSYSYFIICCLIYFGVLYQQHNLNKSPPRLKWSLLRL